MKKENENENENERENLNHEGEAETWVVVEAREVQVVPNYQQESRAVVRAVEA
jgi:hypothetical protein